MTHNVFGGTLNLTQLLVGSIPYGYIFFWETPYRANADHNACKRVIIHGSVILNTECTRNYLSTWIRWRAQGAPWESLAGSEEGSPGTGKGRKVEEVKGKRKEKEGGEGKGPRSIPELFPTSSRQQLNSHKPWTVRCRSTDALPASLLARHVKVPASVAL